MSRRKLMLGLAIVLALLGTALVFLYVRGADNRAVSQYSTVQVYVAQQQINPGDPIETTVSTGKMALVAMPQTALPTGAFNTTDALAGKTANTTIYPGEIVLMQQFSAPGDTSLLEIPKGDTAISINLTDTARVAGFVNPGSTVGIYFTGTDNTGQQQTRVLLAPVTVIAVGSTTVTTTTTKGTDGAQTTEQLPRTLMTLAVNQQEAQKIIFASTNGSLAFGLVNSSTKTDLKLPGTNTQNLFK